MMTMSAPTPNTQMAKASTGKGGLRAYLDSPEVRAKLAEVARGAMNEDVLIRLALMAQSRQPDLAKCSQISVLRSLIDAAELGIKPGGTMGRGYLIPRKNKINQTLECTFDPGWRGLIDIARRSGQIKRIEAHVVYDQDQFEVMRSPFTSIRHVPCESDKPGGIRAAFAIAEFSDGAIQIEVLWKRDLDKIRNSSASKAGPWANWADEMSRKSAVRRLCKYLPFDPMLDRALEISDDEETTPEPVAAPPPRATLADKIKAKRAQDIADAPMPEVDMSSEEKAEIEAAEAAEALAAREPGEEG